MIDNMYSVFIAIFASGGLFTLIQFFITRYDNKKNLVKLVNERIDELGEQYQFLADQFQEYRAVQARVHILRFADDLHNNLFHSEEFFRQLMIDIDVYDNFCGLHPDFKNGMTQMASDYIKDEYRQRFLIQKGENKNGI